MGTDMDSWDIICTQTPWHSIFYEFCSVVFLKITFFIYILVVIVLWMISTAGHKYIILSFGFFINLFRFGMKKLDHIWITWGESDPFLCQKNFLMQIQWPFVYFSACLHLILQSVHLPRRCDSDIHIHNLHSCY